MLCVSSELVHMFPELHQARVLESSFVFDVDRIACILRNDDHKALPRVARCCRARTQASAPIANHMNW